MSTQTITAAALDRSHIWRMMRVEVGDAVCTDHLRAVTHDALVVADGAITDPVPCLSLGRVSTTLTFLRLGTFEVSGETAVVLL